MRWLINYIRSCFCKHEWELIKHIEAENSGYPWKIKRNEWMYRCNQCGCSKIIKNY